MTRRHLATPYDVLIWSYTDTRVQSFLKNLLLNK